MTTPKTKAPFPYFGGKAAVADLIWERFGSIRNYVEPFFGSGAVLLGCPWPGHTETVNDADGLLANFWRALQADPAAVAQYADYPVSELDLHARHAWLVQQRADVTRLLADPDWYDAKIAGWWVWGISQWIGSGWCPTRGTPTHQLPHVTGSQGVHRKRPALGGSGGHPHHGRGVHRQGLAEAGATDVGGLYRKIPHVGNAGRGTHRTTTALHAELTRLSQRLRRTRVICGDFARILTPAVTTQHGLTAVLLDPPYDRTERADLYAVESDTAHRARVWAWEHGDDPLLRIAYCGYDMGDVWPTGWVAVPWKANGGYGNQGGGRGRANAQRECIWFSPHCLHLTPLEQLIATLEAQR